MQVIGYILFVVVSALFVWYLVSSVNVIIQKIKLIKKQKQNKIKDVQNTEVQGDVNNNNKEN